MTAKLANTEAKVVYGNREELETILLHGAVNAYNFEDIKDKRVLVKGCTDQYIPENAYVVIP